GGRRGRHRPGRPGPRGAAGRSWLRGGTGRICAEARAGGPRLGGGRGVDAAEPPAGRAGGRPGPAGGAGGTGACGGLVGSAGFGGRRWHARTAGVCAGDATSLVGYDGRGAAVAAITVWSAGPGRPGLIEPMGVHAEHRGHGYGRGITLAGAAALRERGASSVRVCTPSSLTGAVATYRAAGLVPGPERTDRRREG